MVERIREIVDISGKELLLRLLGVQPLPPTPEEYIEDLTAALNERLALTAWTSPTVEALGFPTVHFRTPTGPRGVIFFDLAGPRFQTEPASQYLTEVRIGVEGVWDFMERLRIRHPYRDLIFFLVTDKKIAAADAAVLGMEGLNPFDNASPKGTSGLASQIQRRYWKVTHGQGIRTQVSLAETQG